MPPTPSGAPISLVGGVVAHNEEASVATAIRSLTDQELGDAAVWSEIWVVASGCTDRTVERVRAIAASDPRVRLIVQPTRQGKGLALNEVLDRADGDAVVLLNGDAEAEPNAVRSLLRTAADLTPPFAVMGRPIPRSRAGDRALDGVLSLLWAIHDEVHRSTIDDGSGNHLSDELLLLSLPVASRFTAETVNDGAELGAALVRSHGSLRYATEARVRVETPTTALGYLRQRRRIYAGHAQVTRAAGVVPTTMVSLLIREPRRGRRILARAIQADPHRGSLPALVALESLSLALAVWDRLPPRRDHARWRRLPGARAPRRSSVGGSPRT
ncbi:MAG: glycosyltransferase [Thermoplasmata archaeon]